MATAEQKKTITKKRLQELRNQCRDHYNVVADGVQPDGADVRVTMGKLQELIELLDGKAKWDDSEASGTGLGHVGRTGLPGAVGPGWIH